MPSVVCRILRMKGLYCTSTRDDTNVCFPLSFTLDTSTDYSYQGIPEHQKNHAVIMARFSRDCMRVMRQVTRKLSEKLGEDTNNLEMRVGLHSGSTTAGVLRGEKARFQLFGDTVNTGKLYSNSIVEQPTS